ncbi:hypothetical protein [Microbispora catharanthi]|uniref:Uncharacterized protein n=1 Tax=Microbispora catharanthi TaxID=1712871 RepID=A0A5N6C4D2_9ACTN|nr:hypothetical protein [Microbispora catharanthi]KAB8187664.1 hypothetical protein FH610_000340 [Microbispora catharanthi]
MAELDGGRWPGSGRKRIAITGGIAAHPASTVNAVQVGMMSGTCSISWSAGYAGRNRLIRSPHGSVRATNGSTRTIATSAAVATAPLRSTVPSAGPSSGLTTIMSVPPAITVQAPEGSSDGWNSVAGGWPGHHRTRA